MLRLARAAVRHPLVALVLATTVVAALALVGLGVERSLSPSITTVPGTESSRAQELAEDEFGPSALVPILLEGPRKELDRQGPTLVRTLTNRTDTRVISAWDRGETGEGLRPRPEAAMIVASVAQTGDEMVEQGQADIETIVAKKIHSPLRVSVTGQASIDRAMKDQAIDATRNRMALTLPILFVVLLLLLRAPVAALLVTLLGAGTAFAGLGLTALAGKVTDVDAISVLLGTMTGLVLGVGYGVLIHVRWRALRPGRDRAEAAAMTATTAGWAVLVGGTAMVVANLVADAFGPTAVLSSLFITSTLCGLLAIGAAVVVMPAALALLGARADWGRFPAPAPLQRAWDRLVAGGGVVVRGAVVFGAAATLLLAALAVPLLAIETGPPTAAYLPSDDPARQSFERVAKVMGPGWPTPYDIVVVSRTRPITDEKLLADLDRFQDRLAKDPRITSVIGPGVFAATSEDLGVLPKQLSDSTKLLKGGKRDLGRLERGLGQAGGGVETLRSGLEAAAAGAGQIQGGSGDATAGAAKLRAGLGQARTGASRIASGLDEALSGARQLRTGSAAALTGSQRIRGGIGQAVAPVKAGAPVVKQMAGDIAGASAAVADAGTAARALSGQLAAVRGAVAALPESAERTAALTALSDAQAGAGSLDATLGKTGGTLNAASGVAKAFAGQVAQLSEGLAQLYAGSTELATGIGRLKSGNADLASGIERLADGGGQLTTGVTALRDGAAALEAGLGQLTGGAGQLASGLSAGVSPSGRLISGLREAEGKVAQFRSNLPSPKDIERLREESPGLFDSGYFVLAAIEGAPASQRTQATFAVNLEQGGNAGRIAVVSKYAADDPRSRAVGTMLRDRSAAFAKVTGTEVALGGPAAALGDFRSDAAESIVPVVVGILVVLFVMLAAMLRTVVLPAIALAFDLLATLAALGLLTVLFSGDDPLLGGPGYLDPVSIIAAFTAMFGMTIVYEVQLLARTRELFLATGDAHGALRTALSQTAGATTGAAVAMVAAIVPFAASDLIVAQQLGIGVALVIVLDALVVRPVLLPAAVELLGRAAWWPVSRRAPHAPEEPPGVAPEPAPEPAPDVLAPESKART